MLEIEEIISEAFVDTLYADIYEMPKRDLGLIALIQPLTLSVGLMLWRAKGFTLTQEDYELVYDVSAKILNSFVMQAPVAVALFDTELRYQALSPQWYQNPHLVTPDKEVLQQRYQDVSPYHSDGWMQVIRSALDGEMHRHEEDLWIISEDIQRWMRWEVQPWYLRRNQVGGVLVYCEDITDRKEVFNQVQELLQEKDDLEAIAYMCPHDLQAHIRTLSSFIKLLSQDSSKQNADKYLNFIQGSLEGIKSLVQDSLMHARLKSMDLEKNPEDLNEILKLAMMSLKLPIEQRRANIHNNGLPIVPCHGQTIRQVFENLISNALKFSPEENPRVEVSAEDSGNFWQIRFQDFGVGISSEDQQKIFQNFYRVYGESQFPGTGLGLSFCRKVIEKHGGQISVQSTLGKGSTFTLILPKEMVD